MTGATPGNAKLRMFLGAVARGVGIVLLAAVGMTMAGGTFAQTPFPIGTCPADRITQGLNCTANDVTIASITVANAVASCTAGQPVLLALDVEIQAGAQARYDIGVFIAEDGGNILAKSSLAGSAQVCVAQALPTSAPWSNLNGNLCGDTTATTGTQILHIPLRPYLCIAGADGNLMLPGLVSWAQGANTSACPTSDPAPNVLGQYVAPGSPAKCSASLSTTIPVEVLGSITINKTVVGSNGTFAFTGTGFGAPAETGAPPFSIDTSVNAPHVISGLSTGPSSTYTITETAPAGYNLTSLQCSGGTVTTDLATRTATINLTTVSPNVTCTFTNAQTGSINIVKNTFGGDATFQYTASAPIPSPFAITTTAGTGNLATTALPAGTYTISEIPGPAGWPSRT